MTSATSSYTSPCHNGCLNQEALLVAGMNATQIAWFVSLGDDALTACALLIVGLFAAGVEIVEPMITIIGTVAYVDGVHCLSILEEQIIARHREEEGAWERELDEIDEEIMDAIVEAAALEMQEEEVEEVIATHEEIADIKAAAPAVRITSSLVHVHSDADAATYAVTCKEGGRATTCNCAHRRFRGARCKHMQRAEKVDAWWNAADEAHSAGVSAGKIINAAIQYGSKMSLFISDPAGHKIPRPASQVLH